VDRVAEKDPAAGRRLRRPPSSADSVAAIRRAPAVSGVGQAVRAVAMDGALGLTRDFAPARKGAASHFARPGDS
jgi:hypothetical protein